MKVNLGSYVVLALNSGYHIGLTGGNNVIEAENGTIWNSGRSWKGCWTIDHTYTIEINRSGATSYAYWVTKDFDVDNHFISKITSNRTAQAFLQCNTGSGSTYTLEGQLHKEWVEDQSLWEPCNKGKHYCDYSTGQLKYLKKTNQEKCTKADSGHSQDPIGSFFNCLDTANTYLR